MLVIIILIVLLGMWVCVWVRLSEFVNDSGHVCLLSVYVCMCLYGQAGLLSLGGVCCWPKPGLPEAARAGAGDGISIKN